jgi:hypothetical protein
MSLEAADHSGWVYKQGSLVRNWKKRFMVLRGRQLTYYDTARLTPSVKEKGSFTVITVELSTEIQNGLLVHGRGGRVLKLYTDSAESTSSWYARIMEATAPAAAVGGAVMDRRSSMAMSEQYRYSSMASSAPGAASVDLDDELELMERLDSLPLDDAPVTHSGWLKKEGSRVKSWKRRFFALRGNALSYFDSEDTGAAAKGYGHVQAIEVNDTVANGLDITFDNGRVLRVSAKTRPDMEMWLCQLSDAIEQANAERHNVRQSLAARSSFRVSAPSMLKPPSPPRPQPMRRSLVGALPPMQTPTQLQSQSQTPPLPPRQYTSMFTASTSLDKRGSSTDSYLSSELSASYRGDQPTTTSFVETDSDEYLSDESEGDWI